MSSSPVLIGDPQALGAFFTWRETVYTNPVAGDVIARANPQRVALRVNNAAIGTDTWMSTSGNQSTNQGLWISDKGSTEILFKDYGPLVGAQWAVTNGGLGAIITVFEVLYQPAGGAPGAPAGG